MVRKPYLIQRMTFKDIPTGDTIDGILKMDYMGSAEFEFGALPKSLKFLTKNFNDLTIERFEDIKNYEGLEFYIIGLPSDIAQYSEYINDLINDKLFLKERTHLPQMVKGVSFFNDPMTKDCFEYTDAWWDIENNIMFTFGSKNTVKILESIYATREKKRSENAEGWF